MLKLIVIYEISFVLFWNILYHSNSGVENWFEERILSAIYTVLSTMALGFAIVYTIYITAKISGILERIADHIVNITKKIDHFPGQLSMNK